MNLQTLQKQIIENKLESLYIFTGDEVGIMDVYLEKIIKDKSVKRIESINDIYHKLQNKTVISSSFLYIIKDDKEFMQQEKLWNNLSIVDNRIVFIYTNIDKRTKFFKQFEDRIVIFEKLQPDMLVKYIQKEGLSSKNSLQLAEMCDCDYSRILLEIDKLKNLSQAYQVDLDKSFKIAVEDDLIHTYTSNIIFDLIDAISRRQAKRVYKLLQYMEKDIFSILGLLYYNIKSILLVQLAGDDKDICSLTGLNFHQVNMVKEKGKKYSIDELRNAMKIMKRIDTNIKLGLIDAELALDYLLIKIL